MPRRDVCLSAGLLFHVFNRSAKKTPLFEGDEDYALFERGLRDSAAVAPVALYAYCLMPNHWHLIVRPHATGALTRFMHRLTMRHARLWRDLSDTAGEGAVYQGRFGAVAVETESHFLRVCCYVERNALRAHLVDRAEQWRWTSLWRRHAGVRTDWLMEWPVSRPANWVEYVNLPQSEEEVAAIRLAARTRQPLGSTPWCEVVREQLGIVPPRQRGRRRTVLKK